MKRSNDKAATDLKHGLSLQLGCMETVMSCPTTHKLSK